MFIVDDIIIFIVAIALSIALAPKPPRPKAATISDFDLPTAEEGRPVPVVFGTCDITGPNVLWYGALSTDPIRKHSLFSSSTVGYKYYLGFHLGLCHGPVDAVTRVTWADNIAWVGNITATGTAGINRPNLFGGESREGGVNAAFDIVMGSTSEAINTYLASILGQVPAYRGITSFIWKTGNITTNYTQDDGSIKSETNKSGYVGVTPYMKPVAIRVKRILQGWANGAWYPEKAVINSTSSFINAPNWTASFASKLNGPITDTATTIGYPSSDNNIRADTLGFILIDAEWLQVTSVNPTSATMTVVRHQFSTAAVAHADGAPFLFWQADTSTTAAMNAAHIIYQCLTDPKWGNGVAATSLNDASFRAAADTFFTEGMGLCMQWVQAATVGDFISIVMTHCNASLVFDPVAGQYSLIPIRGGYDVSLLPSYNEDNISSLEDCQIPGYADQPNEVTLTYTDPATGKTTSITAQNIASVDIQGKVVPVVIDVSGIRSHQLAFNTLGRELSSRTTPLIRIKIKINRSAWKMKTSGLFKFSWADRGLVNVVMRALSVDRGTMQSNMITIEAVQDVFSLGLANYVLATPQSPQIKSPPTPPNHVDQSTGTVISSTRTIPPTAPTDLDSYLVPTGATGVWDGHSGQMARWDAQLGQWVFIDVPSGVPIYDQGSGQYLSSSGGTIINTGIGGASSATSVSFDDSTSHLGALNVQQAIDTLAASMGSAINPRAYANGLWYADTFDGTLFDTPDGVNFTQRNSANQTSFNQLIWRPDTSKFYALKGNTVGRTNSNDIYGSWTYVTIETPTWQGLRYFPELGQFVIWHDNIVRISTDGANTWSDPNTATTAYHTEVLADTPVLYARLGDDTAIDKDSTPSSTNAMLLGVPVLGAGYSPTAGLVTDTNPLALSFSNTTYAESRTSANGVTDLLTDTGAFTIELWMKKFNSTPSAAYTFFTKNRLIPGVTGSAMHTIELGFNTTTKVLKLTTSTPDAITSFPNIGMTVSSSAVDLFDGQVHHVVAQRDGAGGGKLYVDGVQVGTVSGATVDHIHGGTLAAGDIFGSDFNHNTASGSCTIDELALYGTALSAARIAVHYDRGTRGVQGALTIKDIFYDAPNQRHLVFANLAVPSGTTIQNRPQVHKSTDGLKTLQLLSPLMATPTTDDGQIAMVAKKSEKAGLPTSNQNLGDIWTSEPGGSGVADVIYETLIVGSVTYKFFHRSGAVTCHYYIGGIDQGVVTSNFGIPTGWDNFTAAWVQGTRIILVYHTTTGNFYNVQALDTTLNKWNDSKLVIPRGARGVNGDVIVGFASGNSLGAAILSATNLNTIIGGIGVGDWSPPGTWSGGGLFASNGFVAQGINNYIEVVATSGGGDGYAYGRADGRSSLANTLEAPAGTGFADAIVVGSYVYIVQIDDTTHLPTLVRYRELASPVQAATSVNPTGGAFGATGTYFYVITALNAGGETPVSNEMSAGVLAAANTVTLTWTAVPGATSYRIYRGTANGAESKFFTSSGTTFTDTGAAGTAGLPPEAPAPFSTVSASPTGGTMTDISLRYWLSAIIGGVETFVNVPVGAIVGDGLPSNGPTTVSTGSVTLTWPAMVGATAYKLYKTDQNILMGYQVQTLGNVTTFTDTITGTGGGWTLFSASTPPAGVTPHVPQKDTGFAPPQIHVPPTGLHTVESALYADGLFLNVYGIYGFTVDLSNEASPVYYQGPEYAVLVRKADGVTTALAVSETYGTSWTFPSNSYPASAPGHAADALIFDGVRYVLTGLGWSGKSTNISTSNSFTYSAGGALPVSYTFNLLLSNGAGTTLGQASALGKGVAGGAVTLDGLVWTLGPKVKAQANQVSYNTTGSVLPAIDVQSALTIVSGAWGILQDKIFGD